MGNLNNKAVVSTMLAGGFMVEKLNYFFKTYDLTVQQYNVLLILSNQYGVPMNLYMLQEQMIHKMCNTTRLVEKLRLKSLLVRKACENNRRKVEITITDKGLGLLSGIEQTLIDYEKSLTSNLNKEELVQLLYLLEKININK